MGSGDLNVSYGHFYSWPLDSVQTHKNSEIELYEEKKDFSKHHK